MSVKILGLPVWLALMMLAVVLLLGSCGFPSPSYDSGVVPIPDDGLATTDDDVELTHGLGGDPSTYFVDLRCWSLPENELEGSINNRGIGGDREDSFDRRGVHWTLPNQNGNQIIRVIRGNSESACTHVQVRIWLALGVARQIPALLAPPES